MKLEIALIRTGITEGCERGKHLGRTDEPLSQQGEQWISRRAEEGAYPSVPVVYASPMLRCMETARIIYRQPVVAVTALQAMDLGGYEGKSTGEIQNSLHVTDGSAAIQPDLVPGESAHLFGARCAQAFRQIVEEMASKGLEKAAIVAHGLTISAVLHRYCVPRSVYRNWVPQHGHGYRIEYDSSLAVAKLIDFI